MAGERPIRLLAARRSPLSLAVLTALLGVVVSVLAACSPHSVGTGEGRTLMYGDSIAFETKAQLNARGIEVKAYGGVAICDWLQDMRREAATRTVRRVYLEFVGNDFTPCVRSRPQVAAYQQDAATAVRVWHSAGVRVIWVRPPQPRADTYVATPPPPSPVPSTSPSPTPTPTPSETPSATPEPTVQPTGEPTPDPTTEPTSDPAPSGQNLVAAVAEGAGSQSTGLQGAGVEGASAVAPARGPILQTSSARPTPPPAQVLSPTPLLGPFDQIQAVLQAAGADAYVDTSPLISPGRVFAATLPCRAGEQCGVLAIAGSNAARSPDGIHLCPTQAKTVKGVNDARCSVYSTSAMRFAEQVAGVR